jgi:NAD(P)-dependent dehydrogenase (short-subunit alcohol dehydrogenase family)
VVTGAGNGIGRELVLGLMSSGEWVAAVDINEPALQEASHLAGDHKERLSAHVSAKADEAAGTQQSGAENHRRH